MDNVINTIRALGREHQELCSYSFNRFAWLMMGRYDGYDVVRGEFTSSARIYGRSIYYNPDKADGFCLRVIQEQFLHNGENWIYEWFDLGRELPTIYDPYIYEMYMQEQSEKAEKLRDFLVGSRYNSGLVLSKLTQHGVDHASLLRKKIAQMSGV